MEYLRADKVATMLNLSLRSIQLKCKKKNLKKDSEGYLIPEDVVKIWLLESPPKVNEAKAPTKRQRKERKPKTITQEYTIDQYNKLEEIISITLPTAKRELSAEMQENRILEERIKGNNTLIDHLKENLKLANHRIDLLTNMLGESNKTIQQRNTLDLIDKTKPKD